MSKTLMEEPLVQQSECAAKEKDKRKRTETIKKNWKNLWCYFGPTDLNWRNIIVLGTAHLFSVYSLYHVLVVKKLFFMLLFFYFPLCYVSMFGVTAGAHRYYTHRSYKANIWMRILLVFTYASAGMNSIHAWVRDHRIHHKFSDTELDPHNAHRGFFYSHVGWLLLKKHPDIIREGQKVDMQDITNDVVVRFQEKHYSTFSFILCHVLPTLTPWYLWNYNLFDCFCMNMIRWVYILNATWCINSAAHKWGSKPFDKNILPTDSKWMSLVSVGEAWHNYHHTFPWDYKTAELPWSYNLTGFLLDMFAKLGWIYDLKSASKELIEKVAQNRGDGSRNQWGKEVQEFEYENLKD